MELNIGADGAGGAHSAPAQATASSSSSTLFIVDGANGEQLLFADADDAGATGGAGHHHADILQQALQEVGPPADEVLLQEQATHSSRTSSSTQVTASSSSSASALLGAADTSGDLSFLLDSTSSHSDLLRSADAVTAPSAVSNEALLEELAAVAAVDVNTAAAASSSSSSAAVAAAGFSLVSDDGTLVSLESVFEDSESVHSQSEEDARGEKSKNTVAHQHQDVVEVEQVPPPALAPQEEQEQVVTLLRAADGTLRLNAEQAKTLGIKQKQQKRIPDQQQRLTLNVSRARPAAPAQQQHQSRPSVVVSPSILQQKSPAPISVPTVSPSHAQPGMVLVPVNRPDGSKVFVLKSGGGGTVIQQQQQHVAPTVLAQRIQARQSATVLGRRVVATLPQTALQQQQQQQQLAAPLVMMRPVMTPAVATKSSASALARHQPMILPKLSVAPKIGRTAVPLILPKTVAPAPAPLAASASTATTAAAAAAAPPKRFSVVTTGAKSASGTLGTDLNPIQLVQKGPGSFHTTQQLSSVQLSQVANILKRARGQELPRSAGGDQGTRIVVERPDGSKMVYKLLFPEDEEEEASRAKDKQEEEVEVELKSLLPHEIFPDSSFAQKALLERASKTSADAAANPVVRKRGRPRRSILQLERPEVHAKKLRKEFGLTMQELQVLDKDVVADRDVEMEERQRQQRSREEEEEEGVDKAEEEEEEEEADKAPPPAMRMARTRSGRVSRPPAPRDEEDALRNRLEQQRKAAAAAAEAAEPVEPQPKRKFHIQERYRCRVCHKIYLGDRKMNRHIKLYPSHGPSEESLRPPHQQQQSLPPPPMPAASAAAMGYPGGGKKMPPEFALPIIPMARTQLEELVKNLDAELVLEVAAKKMFDNFPMWELQRRKTLLQPGTGVRRLTRLFEDLERMVGEARRLVDSCLTDAKLHGESDPTAPPGISFGENVQNALGLHEGPWYMEPPKHIPEEYHKLLNIAQHAPSFLVASPRSDSNAATAVPSSSAASTATTTAGASMGGGLLMQAGDEDNSNSMMSADSTSQAGGGGNSSGMGAPQMVLEKNLGTVGLQDMDEETQVGLDSCTNVGSRAPSSILFVIGRTACYRLQRSGESLSWMTPRAWTCQRMKRAERRRKKRRKSP